jgi:guanosine-3',5'-bis(diphosphate) 3'-pyrophosphohydrolase
VLSFRVIVQDLGQCYTALGLIHAEYRHLPERLKDYIAIPKSNGYQSIHTVVIGPENRRIEVQIRTAEMHRIAEVGIAAHWRYKEGHLAISPRDLNKMAQLRAIFEAAREIEDSNEFVDALKIDLFAEEVFVFTPAGDVKFFPKGATVLDFAYAIHTEVGNTCTGARIQGRLLPLRYELRSGDTVEIIRKSDQVPRRDWMEIARTGRAQAKIRRVLREGERESARSLGRELLEAALKKDGHSYSRLQKEERIQAAADHFGHSGEDGLLTAIGQGDLGVDKVLAWLAPSPAVEQGTSALTRLLGRFRKRETSPVLVGGESDVLVSYARCCSPLPGNPIVGFITRGRGITIHRADCTELAGLDTERRVHVDWHGTAKFAHTVDVLVRTQDKPGMLADVAGVCKLLGVNLVRFEARQDADRERAVFDLSVNITHASELEQLLNKLQQVKGVIKAERKTAHTPT